MAKHNYSQYSNKNKSVNNANKPSPKERPIAPVNEAKPVVIETVVEPVIKPMIETVDTVTLNEKAVGIVVDCAKLNVRAEPSVHATVLGVLDSMSEIEIDVANSNNEWVKVCTAIGLEGYCMRKYIDTRL